MLCSYKKLKKLCRKCFKFVIFLKIQGPDNLFKKNKTIKTDEDSFLSFKIF